MWVLAFRKRLIILTLKKGVIVGTEILLEIRENLQTVAIDLPICGGLPFHTYILIGEPES